MATTNVFKEPCPGFLVTLHLWMFNKGQKIKIDFYLPKNLDGTEIFVECRRGSKAENHIFTPKVQVSGTTGNFDTKEKLKVNCNLVQNPKTNKFEDKKIHFIVKEAIQGESKKDKKAKTPGPPGNPIAKGFLLLNNYSDHGSIRTESLVLQFEKKPKEKTSRTPTLMLKIESQWVKLNNKLLVKKEEGDAKENSKGKAGKEQTIKVGNDEFALHSADEVTELTAGSGSDEEPKANDDEDGLDDDHKQSNGPKSSMEYEAIIADLQRDKDRLEKKLARGGGGGGGMSEAEKAELEDLRKDKVRLEKKVEKLTKELEDLKAGGSKTAEREKEVNRLTSAPAKDSITKQLQNELKEQDKINKQLQEQVNSLKEENKERWELIQQLEEEIRNLEDEAEKQKRSSAASPTSGKGASKDEMEKLKKQVQELEAQRKENEVTIVKLQQEEIKNIKGDKLKMELKRLKDENSKKTKELEAMKKGSKGGESKNYNELKRQNEELRMIVEMFYEVAQPEYDEKEQAPSAVSIILSTLNIWNTLEDPVNEQLLENIVSAIRTSSIRSSHDTEMLIYWLSLSLHLYKKLQAQLSSDLGFFKTFEENVFYCYTLLLNSVYSNLDRLSSAILEQQSAVVTSPKGQSRKGSSPPSEIASIVCDVVEKLTESYIPGVVIQHIIRQIFYFIDSQLFNTLLKRKDLFTCTSGFQIKMAISQLENAFAKDKDLQTVSKKELNHIREAVNVLTLDKSLVADGETVKQVFAHLNIIQIKHIVVAFQPDESAPEKVPASVIRGLEDQASSTRNRNLELELDPLKIDKVDLFAEDDE